MHIHLTQRQINTLVLFCVLLVCLNTAILFVVLGNQAQQNAAFPPAPNTVAARPLTPQEIAQTPAGKLERYEFTALELGVVTRRAGTTLVKESNGAERQFETTSQTRYIRETTQKDAAVFDAEMNEFVTAMRTAPGSYVPPRQYNTVKIGAGDLKAGDFVEILITSPGSTEAKTVVVKQL